MKKNAFAAMAIATAFGITGAACNVDANGPAQARALHIKQAEYHLERARYLVKLHDMKEADRHITQARRSMNESTPERSMNASTLGYSMNESTRSSHEPGFQE